MATSRAGTAVGTAVSKSGGFFNNPGALALGALLVVLVIFRKDITNALQSGLEGLVNIEIPNPFENFQFPDITFPEFPDFSNIFGGIQDDLSSLAGQIVDGISIPGDTTINEDGTVSSSTSPTFDLTAAEEEEALIQLEINRQKSILEQELSEIPPEEDISGSEFASAINDAAFRAAQQEQEFPLPIELLNTFELVLPQGFEGGGVSFIGGNINEVPLCNKSIGQIAEEFGISASAAANMKFVECEESDFDFGTNTGSGISPTNDQVITGGATLESEEKKAACLTCQLFGLNCAICSGSI